MSAEQVWGRTWFWGWGVRLLVRLKVELLVRKGRGQGRGGRDASPPCFPPPGLPPHSRCGESLQASCCVWSLTENSKM